MVEIRSLEIVEQQERHRRWVQNEGGIEHPTRIETLMQPEQQKRIGWLKKHCSGEVEILDIGCNFGFILNELNGKCGADINPENIKLAKRQFPHRWFRVGDVTKGLDFKDKSFAIVVEADLLEHLEWFNGVEKALREGLRIASRKLLITLPWGKDEKCALCFKHRWVPDEEKLGKIVMWLSSRLSLGIGSDSRFVYIEVLVGG